MEQTLEDLYQRSGADVTGGPADVDPAVRRDVARVIAAMHDEDVVMATTPGQNDEEVHDNDLLRKIRLETDKDEHYKALREALQADSPSNLSEKVRRDMDRFILRDGCLYRLEQLYRGGRARHGSVRYLLYVPEALRQDVLFACHDHLLSGGHLGVKKTFEKLRSRYYWTNMFKSVEDWCRSCVTCLGRKNPAPLSQPTTPLPIPANPFEMVSVDVLGPFLAANGTGNRYIVVYCDHLTRWVEAVAFRTLNSLTIARMLVERIMCRHGAPKMLLSDRGAPFLSALANEVYRILRIKKLHTAAYRPQTNGLVERFNATIATMLSMFTDSQHKDWDRFLPYLVFAYNTSVNPGTKESPFFMLYGREARLPLDVMMLPDHPNEQRSVEEYCAELVEGLRLAHEDGREALKRGQQLREMRTGPGRNVVEYKEGDLVMIKDKGLAAKPGMTKKLLHLWSGPFKILSKVSRTTYMVTGVDGRGRAVSTDRLKRHYGREHVEAEEDDYADHLTSTGAADAGEGNRTAEPNAELDKQGEGRSADARMTAAEEYSSQDVRASQSAASSSSQRRKRSSSVEPAPAAAPERSKRRKSSRVAARTPVPPDGGLIQLCAICKLPKRGHVCSGKYVPVRQAEVNRRRIGIAAAGAPALFGLLTTNADGEAAVSGVYSKNDFRQVFNARVPSWSGICESRGRTGDDIWDDECDYCNRAGKVINCFSCNRVYHHRCLTRPVLHRPLDTNEELLCESCFRDALSTGTSMRN